MGSGGQSRSEARLGQRHPDQGRTAGFCERGYPHKVDGKAHVAGKGSQVELAAHVLEASHQKRPLSHPRSERLTPERCLETGGAALR